MPYFTEHGPSPRDLSAIEAEWPLIAAELEVLDAQIACVTLGGQVSELDVRRVRRAQRRVLEVSREMADRETATDGAA